jgi:hypothetical protein
VIVGAPPPPVHTDGAAVALFASASAPLCHSTSRWPPNSSSCVELKKGQSRQQADVARAGSAATAGPCGAPERTHGITRAGRNLRGPEAIVLAPRLSLTVPALAADAIMVADALTATLAAVDLLPSMFALPILFLHCRTMPSAPRGPRGHAARARGGALTSRLRIRMRFGLLGSTRPFMSLPAAAPARWTLCPGLTLAAQARDALGGIPPLRPEFANCVKG